jgi:hypothetical protein
VSQRTTPPLVAQRSEDPRQVPWFQRTDTASSQSEGLFPDPWEKSLAAPLQSDCAQFANPIFDAMLAGESDGFRGVSPPASS